MAAPLDSKYSLSRKRLKIIFASNIISSLCILSLIYFPFDGKSSFDFVNNCQTATKFAIIGLWILNLTIAFVSRSLNNNLPRQKVMADIRKGGLLYFCSILLAYFIAVVKGAPVTESVPETFHFALVLATAAVVPGLVHLGVNTDTWIRIFTMNSPETALERVVQFTTISSIIGAWLGAFPIPLDWDRPWQVWPITCVLGVLLGYVVGLVTSALYLGYQSYRLKLKST